MMTLPPTGQTQNVCEGQTLPKPETWNSTRVSHMGQGEHPPLSSWEFLQEVILETKQ